MSAFRQPNAAERTRLAQFSSANVARRNGWSRCEEAVSSVATESVECGIAADDQRREKSGIGESAVSWRGKA
jgi:hypothetical protein